MFTFDPSSYGPVIAEILHEDRLMPLGPGTPNEPMRSRLEALSPETVLAGVRMADRDMAAACCAALWLYHDFLDESHAISQEIHTTTGGYWHGIMHRREPDASNARYWFRRVGEHPIFEELGKDAGKLAFGPRPDRWDPFQFITLCEKYRGTGTEQETDLRQLQRKEWELLFDWCFRYAANR